MFSAVMLAIVLLDGWGMLGVFTDRFGFRNVWEVWVYQVFYGLLYAHMASSPPPALVFFPWFSPPRFFFYFKHTCANVCPNGLENSVCPWYSYSQIMISEVTPRGREFLFFSLFGVVGKTSSFIGPLVSSAIVDRAAAGGWADGGGGGGGASKAASAPFLFLFALSLVSCVGLAWGVDLGKSRREQEVFLEKESKEWEGREAERG